MLSTSELSGGSQQHFHTPILMASIANSPAVKRDRQRSLPMWAGRQSIVPPIGRQLSRTCRGKDGLSKAFEDAGDGRESLLSRVYVAQELFQLRHNAALFVDWR